MAQIQTRPVNALDKVDPVWSRIRQEAEDIARREPELASFIYENILHHDTLETAVAHRVSQRLEHPDVSSDLIRQAFREALEDQPALGDAFRADIVATIDRDPATTRFIEPVLYYKGFHAIQTHRLAHWLIGKGRKDFALYLQSRSSAAFQCDINPHAVIGRGIFLDHATGLVVGETAVIDDDRRRRENSRQYRNRPLLAYRRRLRRHQGGAAQCDRRRHSGESGRRSRLCRALAHHGPDAARHLARWLMVGCA